MDKTGVFFIGMIRGVLALAITWLIIVNVEPTPIDVEPTPIDVYRGRTTLEITYRDSIPIDSVVVFK